MTPYALIAVPMLAFLFLGWLVFAWNLWRYGGAVDRFWSLSKFLGLAAVLALYAGVATSPPTSLFEAGLLGSYVTRRAFWAVWALYGLPLWGLGMVLFPDGARDVLMRSTDALYLPSGTLAFIGWFLVALAWLVFLLFAAHL